LRVCRVLTDGGPRLGVAVDGAIFLPAMDVVSDCGIRTLVEDPERLAALSALAQNASAPADRIAIAGAKLLAPVADPGKVVAIGLNYVDHAAESRLDPPAEPLVLAKFPSSIIGHGEEIRAAAVVTAAVDFEAELAVVIGRPARNVTEDDALEHVFGYTCLNDVSARDLQFRDGQWVRAKSLDTFCPIGPWIVTADEIADPQALAIRCIVSGEMLQQASTADMIFGVATLISRLSHWFTLEPGDVIATGTPPGVGFFRSPRRLLVDGDEVVVEIDGVGRLANSVVIT
jgi:2-keto-4-pentenoate hydratase/2-oxohepta-3-ene-1,7-dioic acid hydratase in catechol pathway